MSDSLQKGIKNLKVAIVHEYLIQYGGAEKTLEAILELFPNAPIYAGVYEKFKMSKIINNRKIYSLKNPIFARFIKFFTFLMPFIFEHFDLTKYDLIISDGTAWPKGVLTNTDQLHISYIHTPPRFLYGYSVESQKRNKWYFRPAVKIIDKYLKIWDFAAAQRPDFVLANSNEVKKRIKRFYKRDATVIYPPVDISYEKKHLNSKNAISNSNQKLPKTNYYLLLGRLSAYKNFDFVIEAFNKMGKTLVVAGTGVEKKRLKAIARKNIIFEGRVNEARKTKLLQNCKGLINPVEDEDLGIVPIEAMSYGKPVLVHKSGGHLETVIDGVSGMFFESLKVDGFIKVFEKFDKKIDIGVFNTKEIKASVQKFSKERFKKEMSAFIEKGFIALEKR